MALIICPGVHDELLSDRFITVLQKALLAEEFVPGNQTEACRVLPTQRYVPFDGLAVWSYVQAMAPPREPLFLIGFSAGVVGATAAANLWRGQGRRVAAMIAIDGWGVPQVGDFPFHRVSHDYFTHWSSAMLGAGLESFYADPAVEHLDLWQFPDQTIGRQLFTADMSAKSTQTTAIACIAQWLLHYGCHPKLHFSP
ncbi:hypothetical protein PN498_03945 [Oscillatoria sp. CS-180]|uniref:hypothetical protein n=1 Tax=Oscillatoria sp. CS-180 TaxID=3021720 RepID=UPI00232BF7D6|nr:hypothetical protein [Oscillatoria sp. CS-180]MDB9525128.1 hypothetical protein [Oscillatoria sp. CS-180]